MTNVSHPSYTRTNRIWQKTIERRLRHLAYFIRQIRVLLNFDKFVGHQPWYWFGLFILCCFSIQKYISPSLSTQGFSVSLFYCFLNSEVRLALRHRLERWRDERNIRVGQIHRQSRRYVWMDPMKRLIFITGTVASMCTLSSNDPRN